MNRTIATTIIPTAARTAGGRGVMGGRIDADTCFIW